MNGTAKWTFDPKIGAWYFALGNRKPGPYLRNKQVTALVDMDNEGNIAGLELLDRTPPSQGRSHRKKVYKVSCPRCGTEIKDSVPFEKRPCPSCKAERINVVLSAREPS